MRIDRFDDVDAWQLVTELISKVYTLIKKWDFANDFGLKKQIQDADGSSMHNIAEGYDSETNPAFVFLGMQNGLALKSKVKFMWI